MKVFVTGATGFIGSVVVDELIGAGHQVLGLARSDSAKKHLLEKGAEVLRGDLEDLDSLRRGAQDVDGVIHLGFIHDFGRFQEVCETDRKAIETLGAALGGSNRPLIVTSGTALVNPGTLATEDMVSVFTPAQFPRVASEVASRAMAARGVPVSIIRLSPSVHGDGDHGFAPILINTAREKGVAAFVGAGVNRWTAVHRLDAAKLYRLALEKAAPLAVYHGVAEEGIAFAAIAEVIGKQLDLPVASIRPDEADSHFSWFSKFAALDCPASSKATREQLGWKPVQRTLLADMEKCYFKG